MGWWSDMWGNHNEQYGKDADAIAGLAKGYDPYVSGGKTEFQNLMNEASNMTKSPWSLQDDIASHYQQSPGFQYAQNQINNRMNNNAALTGMVGSGAANTSLQNALAGHLQQDQGQYVDRAMGTYNRGMGTQQNINQMGYNALGDQNTLMQDADNARLQGELSKAQSHANMAGYAGHLLGEAFGAGSGDLGSSMPSSVGYSAGSSDLGQFGGKIPSFGGPGGGYAADSSPWWESFL